MNTDGKQQPLLTYDGDIGNLYAIFFKNLLLNIVTFGIYRFWAKTNYRRYAWSHMRFQNERFEYTGTGGELFVGYLIVFAIVFGSAMVMGVLVFVLTLVTGSKALGQIPVFVWYFVLIVFASGAYYSAQRYRLSRTSWCGIRGGMSGSMFVYGLYTVLYWLLAIVTLGQMTPWITLRLAERRINASSFGSETFRFQGQAGKLYGMFVATFVGAIVVVGLIALLFMAWIKSSIAVLHSPQPDPAIVFPVIFSLMLLYCLVILFVLLIRLPYYALVVRHITGNTSLGALRFGSTITFGKLAGLIAGNAAIALFTLGWGYPVVLHRSLKFAAATLMVEGAIDPATLGQNTQQAPRTGEGMLSFDHSGGF